MNKLKSVVKILLESTRLSTAKLARLAYPLAALHLFIFSRHLVHEYIAVISGGLRFNEMNARSQYNEYFLRRNVHRLEKGMIMRPRRRVFAESYIIQLVECYRAGLANGVISAADRAWAESVLSAYFDAVANSQVVDFARKRYAEVSSGTPAAVDSRGPVMLSLAPKGGMEFADLKTLCMARRSIRWFQDTSVPQGMIDSAIEVAISAPSACNRQPYHFYVSHGQSAGRVAKIALGTTGLWHQFPCVLAVVGDLSGYAHERDRHAIYIDSALAAMQFVLAAEAMGLGSCIINWPDIRKKDLEIQDALGLEKHQRVAMLIAVGYPLDGQLVPLSRKRSVEDSVVMGAPQ